jgi:hypothetical protein
MPINIKRGVLLTMALLIDLLGANGIATFLALSAGIPSQIISKIEVLNGEFCCLKVGLMKNRFNEVDVFVELNLVIDCNCKACNNNSSRKCTISIPTVKTNLDSLTQKGVLTFSNNTWFTEL